jgi:hypothetical protein
MHLVVITSWKEETTELAQALASALGITAYEARPRMIGAGPAVVASFADSEKALELVKKLNQSGFATLVVDAIAVRSRADRLSVRHFQFNKCSLRIETSGGQQEEIPYEEIDLLLPGTSIVGTSEIKTVIERKFSLGKTLLSGGIPMTSKIEHQEEVTNEARGKVLYLYAGKRSPFIFSQNSMTYDGFGSSMKLTRELNFAYLISELQRFCPGAKYDDRLLNRVGQVRLLGPTLNPETNLDLAVDILAASQRDEPVQQR